MIIYIYYIYNDIYIYKMIKRMGQKWKQLVNLCVAVYEMSSYFSVSWKLYIKIFYKSV